VELVGYFAGGQPTGIFWTAPVKKQYQSFVFAHIGRIDRLSLTATQLGTINTNMFNNKKER